MKGRVLMKDYVIRATSKNGEVRAFVATTRNLVEEARKSHGTTKVKIRFRRKIILE